MKIYVASSWRNENQPVVVETLRADGHEVYDFRNPPGRAGFGWEQVGLVGGADGVTAPNLVSALQHPVAREGFAADMGALRACDACVLVGPAGNDAHLELGWAVGAGKRTAVLLPWLPRAGLMYSMVEKLALHLDDLRGWLKGIVCADCGYLLQCSRHAP